MRLVSIGAAGAERPGVLVGSSLDQVVWLHEVLPHAPLSVRALLTAQRLPELSASLRDYRGSRLPLAGLRVGPPISDPTKIICVGLNYRGHAQEQNLPWPERPMLFGKGPNALCGARDAIQLPQDDCGPDYEVELAVVIGQRCKGVSAADAMTVIAGYMVGNDVSARRWQKADVQFFRAKSADTFYPCGPALVTADEIADVRALRLTTSISDVLLQDGLVSDLIHDLPTLIAFISRDITLEPGDIISTGTPGGVGCYRSPPRFLRAGDAVVCAISGLGELRNPVHVGEH